PTRFPSRSTPTLTALGTPVRAPEPAGWYGRHLGDTITIGPTTTRRHEIHLAMRTPRRRGLRSALPASTPVPSTELSARRRAHVPPTSLCEADRVTSAARSRAPVLPRSSRTRSANGRDVGRVPSRDDEPYATGRSCSRGRPSSRERSESPR